MNSILLQVCTALLLGGGAVFVALRINTKYNKFKKEVDTSVSLDLLAMIHKEYVILETEYDDIFTIRYGLFRRLYVDHLAVYRSVKFILHQATGHMLCFRLISEYVEAINDVVDELGTKDRVTFIYNKKDSTVMLKIFTDKEIYVE